jgi:hypothetical protein
VASRTRRRLILCSLIVALTLPAEAILLQAATSDPKTLAIEWAQSLPEDVLRAVGDDIASFPFIYRRAIMRFSKPERRSQIWRACIYEFLNAHPDLPAETVAALQSAIALATPENLSNPSAAAKAQTQALGEKLRALLGKEDADDVLYRLGPRDGTFTSHAPVNHQLTNWVRAKLTAFAAPSVTDCDCNLSWGCDGGSMTCRDSTGCTVDDSWPACGFLWNSDCDGKCRSIYLD